MKKRILGFVAYPGKPDLIGEPIEAATHGLNMQSQEFEFKTWKALDVPGRFIAEEVLGAIEKCDCFVADITYLNFNVIYEIGYAIGKKKGVLLIRNSTLEGEMNSIQRVGIFDTLAYIDYQNSRELQTILRDSHSRTPLDRPQNLNSRVPLYFVDAKHKTDWVNGLVSRVKRTRLNYRSFDPSEQPRLSAHDAINQVAQSYGVLSQLLSRDIRDHDVHNLRAAFISGLAAGMNKPIMIIQYKDDPVPIDYRDLVRTCYHIKDLDEAVTDFAAEVTQALQEELDCVVKTHLTFLEKLDLGASSAENELRYLNFYYVETDGFRRAARGEARLVVGRKGAGKTAVFMQIRERVGKSRKNIVLDLKPDGYKLLKFKDTVLKLLERGSFEHTVMAFWEYILLLEIRHRILESDRAIHNNDHVLYEPYRRLSELQVDDECAMEGDFSERMSRLIDRISTDYFAKYGDQANVQLSSPQVTELVYGTNLHRLSLEISKYLEHKDSLWLLFDNLDKGWPTHGLQAEDLTIIRTLLEATRKMERQLQRHGIEAHTIIFIRNDVYELLIEETPDRGKETKVLLDWVDSDMLREMIRRRIIFNDLPSDTNFDDIWPKICVSHLEGQESSDYLIDRSLMRPRYLIDLINHCKSFAINLKHSKIDHDDIRKGLKAYSSDLVSDIGLEVRDVYPQAENILYAFISSKPHLSEEEVLRLIEEDGGIDNKNSEKIVDLLIWYGFLGVTQNISDEPKFIFNVNYNMSLLKGMIKKMKGKGLLYYINPAFWPGLSTEVE